MESSLLSPRQSQLLGEGPPFLRRMIFSQFGVALLTITQSGEMLQEYFPWLTGSMKDSLLYGHGEAEESKYRPFQPRKTNRPCRQYPSLSLFPNHRSLWGERPGCTLNLEVEGLASSPSSPSSIDPIQQELPCIPSYMKYAKDAPNAG